MLHEILLSLSGHPSPLLRNDFSESKAQAVLSPPERELLRTARHISDLHCKLISRTTQISASHPSVICRAVSTATKSDHLAAFQRKILEVEGSILRKDAALVGAYNIVPLTAVIGEFSGWTRRLEWLWELAQFMLSDEKAPPCRAAQLINKLRNELQTGYADIEQTALSLVKVAETAWLKQISAWVLYGRIPVFGGDDFFIREDESDEQGYSIDYDLLPSFVTPYTANSMLFIGTSLNRVRARSSVVPGDSDLRHLSSQLQELSNLTFPLSGPMLSRAITSIRLTLSRTTLQKLLPLTKVLEMLQLLRDFFLIRRGEFAMALTQQADEKVRSRWRRADNLAYEKRDGFGTIVVKEGEVAAALNRTWAVLGAMQGEHAEEDEELELARDLLRLNLPKTKTSSPMKAKVDAGRRVSDRIVATPFRNLLFSVPVILTLQIPSPLDLFLSTSDLDTYTAINSYLLSIRRAHLRLTDLWKITSLRRHHPAPPRPPYSGTRGGIAKTRTLRRRYSARSSVMRSPWSTSSAAIFFLAETEAYLQVEVVEGLWEHFHNWVMGSDERIGQRRSASSLNGPQPRSHRELDVGNSDRETAELSQHTTASQSDHHPKLVARQHDPQTLSTAHRLYLRALTQRLLLTRTSFTDPLYALLIHIDHLVALIHRLDGIWTSIDLEADEGVVDAFSNLEAEEKDVLASLRDVEAKVKHGIEDATGALRSLSMDSAFLAELEGDGDGFDAAEDESAEAGSYGDEAGIYRPRRVGGVDRLLMKLDFGGWFDTDRAGNDAIGDDVF
ncbi:hypothetical protein DL767_008022 [Monosporascus sp. MG133]|nr:hypothetical protein DL767_008022 [Monosporascus sp. MG133]